MRQFVLAALIVFLVGDAGSAQAMGWGFGGTERFGLFERGQFMHGFDDHDYRKNDADSIWFEGTGPHDWGWHEDGFGFLGHGWRGGFGWGHPYGGDPQERIEDKFAELMESYDTGVAENGDDYFESDAYSEVIDDLECLIAKDDSYLEHAENKVDRLSDLISHLEDKLTSYQEGSEEDQSNDSSEMEQEWLDCWHATTEDWLTQAIDSLTEKKSTLEDKIEMHMSLNDDLNAYLEMILDAGGMTAEVSESSELGAVASVQLYSLPSSANSTAAQGIPEPSSAMLAILGLLGIGFHRRRTRRTL